MLGHALLLASSNGGVLLFLLFSFTTLLFVFQASSFGRRHLYNYILDWAFYAVQNFVAVGLLNVPFHIGISKKRFCKSMPI